MGSVGVVLGPPGLDNDLGLEEGGELLKVEQFVAEPAVEALDERVLPRRARLDVGGGGAGAPLALRHSLGASPLPSFQVEQVGTNRCLRLETRLVNTQPADPSPIRQGIRHLVLHAR